MESAVTSIGGFTGKKFLNNKGEFVTAENSILKSKIIGLYFTATWCPPCEEFTKELVKVYNEINSKDKIFEIVQISNERSEIEYSNSLNLPWLFVPFDYSIISSLVAEYKITFLPILIIVNKDRAVLSERGRTDVIRLKSKAYDEWNRLLKERKEKEKAERIDE